MLNYFVDSGHIMSDDDSDDGDIHLSVPIVCVWYSVFALMPTTLSF